MRRIGPIFLLVALAGTPAQAASLDFEARVEAHRAVERVLWERRIWPESNPGRKPALEEFLPESALRARVEDVLRKSRALEDLWKRPIGALELQTELDRMVRDSRDPAMLQAMLDAVGRDPSLVGEAIVRPVLADRLIRSWYGSDTRFHAAERARAEADFASARTADDLARVAPRYETRTWGREDAAVAPGGTIVLADERAAGLGRIGPLRESESGYAATVVLSRTEQSTTLGIASWPKTTFDAWWSEERERHDAALQETPALALPQALAPDTTLCADNTWTPTGTGAPTARAFHSAVWTGSEMIVWGGYDETGAAVGGARYSPATDSWQAIDETNAPSRRIEHTAVWTGTSMLVWGGYDGAGYSGTGGRYDPAVQSWQPISSTGAPSARIAHTAVWTGSRMIVWGGVDSSGDVGTGAQYDPAADAWFPVASPGPSPRNRHSAVWTGTRMIVWGGTGGGGYLSTGGRYDPVTDSWTPTTFVNAPSARAGHAVVWTGARMLVWGGQAGAPLATGASYDPAVDAWAALGGSGAPAARLDASSVWTGAEMIVWGGDDGLGGVLGTGGRYRPDDDTWLATSLASAPAPRVSHGAVWTGSRMIVWGGTDVSSGDYDDGASYCACVFWYDDLDGDGYGRNTGAVTTCDGSHPAGKVGRAGDCDDTNASFHPGAGDWTCNGVDDDCDGQRDEEYVTEPSACGLGVCQRFGTWDCVNGQIVSSCVPGTPNSPDDATCNNLDDDCDGTVDDDFPIYEDHWEAIANAPAARTNHTAIDTGGEMLVFGGDNGSGSVQTGGLAYNYSTSSWRTLPSGPAKRWHHTAVWSQANTLMIVWGGDDGISTIYNSGSRYNSSTDTWSPTSTSGAPTARGGHVAVFTGSQMLIWGGRNVSTYFNTGGLYDPSANSWSAMTTSGAPAARWQATAVWTGTQMIVWGGVAAAGTGLNTGGRYNPSSNTWTAVNTTGAPSGRYGHVALWTGTEMIVWGGTSDGNNYLANGARYNPSTDSWTSIPNLDAPSRRAWASAATFGDEVWIWGGTYRTNEQPDTALADGARYLLGNNVWVPMNPYLFVPSARARASALLHGGAMWVWGGDPNGAARASGAVYSNGTPCGIGACMRQARTICSGGSLSFQCTPGTPQPEICDGYDNDCNGTRDDNVPVPTGVPTMYGTKLVDNTIVLDWTATPNTSFYDTTKGSLNVLRGSGGDFTSATCMQNDNSLTQAWDPFLPAVGDGTWYLVRPANTCSGGGSWNEGSPAQQGSRDAELAAAALPCP